MPDEHMARHWDERIRTALSPDTTNRRKTPERIDISGMIGGNRINDEPSKTHQPLPKQNRRCKKTERHHKPSFSAPAESRRRYS